MSDLYIGAYWGPRQESLEQCTDRFLNFGEKVAASGNCLSQWYRKAQSKRQALSRPLDIESRAELAQLLQNGQNRKDSDGSIMEDLGFSASIWNGRDEPDAAALSVTCGMYVHSPHLRNAVVLDIPDNADYPRSTECCCGLLAATARAWEPEWAGVISRASRKTRQYVPGHPFVDWMVYVNHTRAIASLLPAGVRVREVDNLGTIVVVQASPIVAVREEDLERIRRVELALGLE